ncbi:YafY family protein [Alkalihalobacillus sp. TS-13]|uniref:helix-turn-helix transcriptional regulator n=1 Tax=Alkalihalobacillus sp. TS-13 TaxID=2842455 RepID=UPI001C878A86|nr:YafY family protein [Alkalihalobacillus sp. TS-13]
MRVERLVSIIYKLLNNEILSASALAEKYDVSQRTIYRDIDAICAAGIPVVSYQGVNGGYGIMDGYKLDKSLLGSYDVGSLISILYSMSTVFEDDRALETIERLKSIDSEAGQRLSVDIGGNGSKPESLRILLKAITNRQVVRFNYVNAKNEKTNRIVEPVRLLYKHSSWYLYGFCRKPMDYRNFKISRMDHLQVSSEYFRQKHDVEENRMPGSTYYSVEHEDVETIELHVSSDALASAMDRFPLAIKTFHNDGSLTISFHVYKPNEANWLWSALLSFGSNIEVMKPVELRKKMKKEIKKIIKLYSEV